MRIGRAYWTTEPAETDRFAQISVGRFRLDEHVLDCRLEENACRRDAKRISQRELSPTPG